MPIKQYQTYLSRIGRNHWFKIGSSACPDLCFGQICCLIISDISANIMRDLFLLFYLPNTPSLAQAPTAEVAIFSSCLPKRLMAGQAMSLSHIGSSDTKTGNGRLDQPQPDTYNYTPMAYDQLFARLPMSTEARTDHEPTNMRLDAFGCVWMRQWIG